MTGYRVQEKSIWPWFCPSQLITGTLSPLVKRFRALIPVLAAGLALFSLTGRAAASTTPWVKVRSDNFVVAGHLSAEHASALAAQFERANALLSRLLDSDYFDNSVPTVVLVFDNDAEYMPFKPIYRGKPEQSVAGYFQPGADVNYITFAINDRDREAISPVVLHEYVHLLVRNRFPRAPLWFNEGLAEYFSRLDTVEGKQQIRAGLRLQNRIDYLRAHELVPLRTLLSVDYDSPYYSDHDKRGIFYAESWALVHLLLGDGGRARADKLAECVDLLASGATVEDAFRKALDADTETLDHRLRSYIAAAIYPEHVREVAGLPAQAPQMHTADLLEDELAAILGDLLLRSDRPDEAESYLQKAIKLNPGLAAARVSLGILRLRENRLAEAEESLDCALASDPESYLGAYYYADVLRREAPENGATVAEYIAKTHQIRGLLKRAIDLAPDFLGAYALLARVDIDRSPDLTEAVTLLKRAMTRAPRRKEFQLLFAEVELRNEEFTAARVTLERLASDSAAADLVRAEARTLLGTLPERERAALQRSMGGVDELVNAAPGMIFQPCDMPEPGPQHKPLRFAGDQVCGRLVGIECAASGVMLTVRAGERTLKLTRDELRHIRFVTYSADVRGAIECDSPIPAQPVLVTYRSHRGTGAVDGEAIAVEFVPDDWIH